MPTGTEGTANAGKHCGAAGLSILEHSDLTDGFLYRWVDCCGATSGQPGKRCECREVKSHQLSSCSDVSDGSIETGAVLSIISDIH